MRDNLVAQGFPCSTPKKRPIAAAASPGANTRCLTSVRVRVVRGDLDRKQRLHAARGLEYFLPPSPLSPQLHAITVLCTGTVLTPSPRSGAGCGWAGFAGDGLLRVGREERSAPGLRPLSRPRIRSSRGRAGALVGWDGCEVRLSVCPVFVPCPVCVPAPPCVFLPVRFITIHAFRNARW